MKKSKRIKSLVAIMAVACFGFATLIAPSTYAVNLVNNTWCKEHFGNEYVAKGSTCVIEDKTSLWATVNTIINVILAIVGVIAVVMIIIGGIQYSTSAGDQGKVTKAKNTILYGIVGLVIALLAFAIVNFVLDSIFNNTSSSSSTSTGSGTSTSTPSGS